MVTCNHKWKSIYFRKINKKKNFQDWIKISNKVICDKCLTIADIKEEKIK